VSGIVLAIQEAGDAENPVAVGAGGIATEGNGEQLERLFLTRKVESIDHPEHLVFARRGEEDDTRHWHGIRCAKRREPGVAVGVDVYIEMADKCDAVFRPLPAAGAKWVGSNIDIRSGPVFVCEPVEVTRRE